jgi:hypothetical protein
MINTAGDWGAKFGLMFIGGWVEASLFISAVKG